MKKTSLKFKINKIRSDAKRETDKILDKSEAKIKRLIKNKIFCSKDTCCLKFFKSKKILKYGNYGCDDYIEKSDYYNIEVEDYIEIQTSCDAGYGDNDTFRIEHVLRKYSVCKKCGRCKLISETLLDYSNDFCRMFYEEEYPKNYIPKNWKPIIKIIK